MELLHDPDAGHSARVHTGDKPFTCPRCHDRVTTRFYGPCDSCRTYLRTTLGGEAREVEVVEYVPRMNVTPNAVAFKDD